MHNIFMLHIFFWCLCVCTLLFQNEVKSHVFFASINWDDLVQKRIPPPFNPSVVNVFINIFISLISNNLIYLKQWHGIKHLRATFANKRMNVHYFKATFPLFFCTGVPVWHIKFRSWVHRRNRTQLCVHLQRELYCQRQRHGGWRCFSGLFLCSTFRWLLPVKFL